MNEARLTMAKNESALQPSQRMRVAYILTLVGGFLDAYTYFERGGVFANAQTGNIVQFGIALANGTPDRCLFYLWPICSFVAGTMTALCMEDALERRNSRLVRRSVLLGEMFGLAIVSFIPAQQEWDMLANGIVSFVAAMQYQAFSTFRGTSIATTMSTGNLQKFVSALYDGTMHLNQKSLRMAAVYFSIIATFTFGAFLSAHACELMGPAALWPAIIALGIAVATITYLRRKNQADGRDASV